MPAPPSEQRPVLYPHGAGPVGQGRDGPLSKKLAGILGAQAGGKHLAVGLNHRLIRVPINSRASIQQVKTHVRRTWAAVMHEDLLGCVLDRGLTDDPGFRSLTRFTSRCGVHGTSAGWPTGRSTRRRVGRKPVLTSNAAPRLVAGSNRSRSLS